MFRESLLENSIERGSRRRLATLLSFVAQAIAACICVALPLLYPDALPLIHANSSMLMPPPSGAPPRAPQQQPVHDPTPVAPTEDPLTIRAPQKIPQHTDSTPDPATIGTSSPGPWVPGAIPGDGPRSAQLLTELIGVPNLHPTIKAPPVSVRLSPGVTQGLLIHRVEPQYPALARTARIQGEVVLFANIGRDGRIENLHIVSGHPLLAQSAVDAVKQWRYRPYMLGRDPVEVETQVTVRFTLN